MHEYDRLTDEVLCALGAAVGEDNLVLFEPMSAHTTFKIGGPARLMLFPESEEQIAKIVKCAAENNIRLIAVE